MVFVITRHLLVLGMEVAFKIFAKINTPLGGTFFKIKTG